MNAQTQCPNTLPYTTVVMTCTFSLQVQMVMHTYTHLYWFGVNDINEEHSKRRGASAPRLRALSDVKAKLKTKLCKSHRLGSAKTDTGYYNYWMDLRPFGQ